MEELIVQGKKAKEAAFFLAQSSTAAKNSILVSVASALLTKEKDILSANKSDMENATSFGLKGAIIDRLLLTPERIVAMAEGLREIAMLEDPVGEVPWELSVSFTSRARM